MAMAPKASTGRPGHRLYGIVGVLGVLFLGVSFAINQGPPPGANVAELHAFAIRDFRQVMLAGWLQAVGPVLLAAFVLGVLTWLPQEDGWLKSMTNFGMTVLMTVSLLEVTLYFAALYPLPEQMTEVSLHLIASVQHLYFVIAAPSVFLPFGLVLIRLRCTALGWSALGLGALFAAVGCLTIFIQVLPTSVTILGALQAVWWLAAAATVAFTRHQGPATVTLETGL